MEIIELRERQDIKTNKSLKYTYSQFKTLLEELRKKKLPENIIETINQDIEEINSSTDTGKKLRNLANKKTYGSFSFSEKRTKINS